MPSTGVGLSSLPILCCDPPPHSHSSGEDWYDESPEQPAGGQETPQTQEYEIPLVGNPKTVCCWNSIDQSEDIKVMVFREKMEVSARCAKAHLLATFGVLFHSRRPQGIHDLRPPSSKSTF